MLHIRALVSSVLAIAILTSSAVASGAITDVRFQNDGAAQANVPVTFGQVFAAGDLRRSDVLVGKLGGATVPLQVDVKATHADGSVRHAVISAILPKLAAGATGTMRLDTGGAVPAGSSTPAALLATGFAASASATIGGVRYGASADQLLKAGAKATWLAGAVASEWHVSAPLVTAAGVAHPHLAARFAIRYYPAVKKARIDVTIENAWAYEPGPQNFTYDADVAVGGKQVWSKAGLMHYHHARWRKVFWYGAAPVPLNVQLNVPYLIASRAVPNYDQQPGVAESLLASLEAGGSVEPMGIGLATAYMPTTGAHSDIGILPHWGAAYVLSMDRRARNATMAAGDGAGSFPVHYRDRATGRPVALASHPRMTILGRPSDAGKDAFPGCGACATPYTADTSHQPSFAYLPYLVTGDYYYLEEMQFWGMWDAFNDNPGYRGAEKGLLSPGQVRGQAWSLRTLVEAAYITPDADALKDDFIKIVDNNLDWYNATYTTGGANKLGVITNGYAFSYQGGTALAPWQDDHFTSAVGHAAELGFRKAEPLLKWKAQFQIGRMLAPGFCWIDAASYSLKVRDSEASPVYATLAEVYQKSFNPNLVAAKCNSTAQLAFRTKAAVGGEFASTVSNDIPGNATSATGYVSNFQPALAFAVDSGYPGGLQAWKLFATRAVRPDYSTQPQFSIIPRTAATPIAVVKATPPAAAVRMAHGVTAPDGAGTWAKVAVEGATFTVPAGTIVRYGAGSAWIYATGSGTASNAYFGRDPAVNVVKSVEAFTPAAKAGRGDSGPGQGRERL
jgi:hypothetical protein